MIVGLTQRVLYHKGQAYDSTDQAWYKFFPNDVIVTIKNSVEQDFDEIADQLDVLVLTGGNDPTIRRITETKLASKMLLRKKPVVGICHGIFLLTDLLGGKVEEGHDEHNGQEHVVMVDQSPVLVNSFHNLIITQPPEKAKILAIDLSGNCEAWIDGTLAGVVWHPERMKTPFLPEEIKNLLSVKF